MQRQTVLPLETPRVMGEETEYMVTPWDLEIRQPQLISYFKKSSAPDAFRDFLSNGARLYMDVGNHPEYATPECLTGRGVATAALAGELLLGAALKQPFGKTARQEGVERKLYKRTSDTTGVAAGNHENYYSQRLQLEQLSSFLVPHLASRIIFSGPGMVTTKGSYSLDQRAWHMSNEVFGGGSTNEYRPFVLSRPEPHSKTGQRVQVISGSANMSSRPTQFRFDSTSLAIRLFEHGMLPSWLTTDAPGNAIRLFASEQFGDNFNFKRAIQLGNRSLTAPQIQYEYASRAKALADEGFLNPYDTAFANRWIDMASDAVDGKIERWSRSIDWMAKLVLIERYRAKEPAITTAKMQGIDLSYHEIPVLHKTVREVLRRGGVIDECVSDEAVEAARLTTPEKTRAVIRGLAVTAAMKEKVDEDDGPFGWDKWPIKLTGDTDTDGRNIFQQITPYLLAE